jgi:hypothetical protein
MSIHDEEVLGKAYDAALMRRLLGYLWPYRLHAALAGEARFVDVMELALYNSVLSGGSLDGTSGVNAG